MTTDKTYLDQTIIQNSIHGYFKHPGTLMIKKNDNRKQLFSTNDAEKILDLH